MPDLNAVGDAITGAVMGRAVEPEAGEGGYTHETNCLNCGGEVSVKPAIARRGDVE